MRSALIEILGALVHTLDSAEDNSVRDQIAVLFRDLLDRTMDINSYVRVSSFQRFVKPFPVGFLKAEYPAQRTEIVGYTLEDKDSIARNNNINCVHILMDIHLSALEQTMTLFIAPLDILVYFPRQNAIKLIVFFPLRMKRCGLVGA